MIINNNIQVVTGAYAVSNSSQAKRLEKTPNTVAADEVQLSSGAQSFSSLLQKLRDSDEVRMDKVNAISQQMAAGTYEIDAGKVAMSILRTRF